MENYSQFVGTIEDIVNETNIEIKSLKLLWLLHPLSFSTHSHTNMPNRYNWVFVSLGDKAYQFVFTQPFLHWTTK
jgi:hypothetical protein